MAIGLLASASRGLAVTMTWTNGSDVWTSPTAWTTNLATGTDPSGGTGVVCVAGAVSNVTATCLGGTGGFPGAGDQARFTNNTSIAVTLNITTNLSVLTVSNTAGIITIDASGSTLTVTGRVRIADDSATSTVVWAGGTLTAAVGGAPVLQIGTAGSNAVGTLIVTNGTVVGGGSISLGTAPGSVGKLVVSGSGIFTNAIGAVPNNVWNFRLRSAGSQLIVTNGGKFFWADQVRAQSNSLILVSGPTSFLSCTGVATSVLTIGDLEGPGSLLIISNGAKVFANNGTVSIGRNNGSSNTGIVVGAGSQLIATNGSGITIGVGGSPHHDNDLIVYDGGYIYTDGAFFNIGGGGSGIFGTNCSFHMGGVGAMSTGFAISVRSNTAHTNALMVVTNAVFTCSVLGQQGVDGKLSVLSKATLIFSNQYAVSATTTNVLNGNGTVLIDGGTISAVSGTNALGVRIGVLAGVPGSTLIITNGGKLLSELGSIGAGSSSNTGIVAGVGSVWSNSATITVGDSTGINNTLVIGGGTIFAGKVRVRSTNTVVFTAGTLSVGAMDIDPGANGSNQFVVGDGTSAAYYDMVPGGDGYHGFSNGGLVVTNGAFLRGDGTLTGTMTVLGTFAPGFSVGSIFTSNSLSFGNSAVLNYDLGASSDSVTVNGNLKLGGVLNIADAGGFGTGNYTLFTYNGTLSAGTLTVGTTPNGSLTYAIDTNTIGSVILEVTGVGGDPFSTWLTHYGLTGGNALGTADPDHDGMSNTNEFLAGFNPTNNAAYLHVISIAKSANDINVTYLGANGDSTYSGGPGSRTNVLEFTTGTANGSYSTNNFASTGKTNILSGGTGVGVVTNMVDSGGATNKPSRFYRVRVLVP